MEENKEVLDVKEPETAEEEKAAQPAAEAADVKEEPKSEKDTDWSYLLEEDKPIVVEPLKEGERLTRDQRDQWEKKANDIIDKIRPYIQHDGGDVDLLGIDDEGIAYVTFLGACAGCMMAGEDFSTGVRLLLLDEFPELKEVVLVG